MHLITERLLITEFTVDMAAATQENSVDEDTRKFVPDEVFENIDDAKETILYLMSQYGSRHGPLVYPVLLSETGCNIGYVQLCPLSEGTFEIGYHIGKKYRGNGYATEAVKAFLPVIAAETGLSEVYGVCLAENRASLAVLKKCGFTPIFQGIGRYQNDDREIVKSVWRC